MSTSTRLKQVREKPNEQAQGCSLDGVLSAAFRNTGRDVLWELVISYYNGKEVGVFEKDGQPVPVVVKRLGIDYLSFRGLERLAVLLLTITGGFRLNVETIDPADPADPQNKAIRKAAEDLRKSQRQFRAAVLWLCSPKESNPAATLSRRRKLYRSGKLEPGRFPLIDKTYEDFIKYFEDHGLRHFKIHPALEGGQHGLPVRLILGVRCLHFVDLFCAFLLNECSGKTMSEMPLKICRLCAKLFSSQQSKAAFCSRDCQWKHYWTDERRRDDKYVKDLGKFAEKCKQKHGFSSDDLRTKLSKDKLRLDGIKRDWKDWPKIIERINAIERLAAGEYHDEKAGL